MRVAFLGTPAIAVPSLDALHGSARHDVVCVLTRPDMPAGRHREAQLPPVKRRAIELGLPVSQPAKAREAVPELRKLEVDVVAVVAYGGWLPPPVLDAAPNGCVNVHPSLLPRWRGAAPVERAIMACDAVTGVTTMQIDEGLDTGPVFLHEEVGIGADETAGELAGRLAIVGASLLVRTLDGIETGSLEAVPQPGEGVTYAEKLTPEECRVDWTAPAPRVDGRIRGANPRPGAWTTLDGRRLKLWRSREGPPLPGEAPGFVVSGDGPNVACGDGGSVVLVEVQPEGRRAMDGAAYLRGHEVAGARLV